MTELIQAIIAVLMSLTAATAPTPTTTPPPIEAPPPPAPVVTAPPTTTTTEPVPTEDEACTYRDEDGVCVEWYGASGPDPGTEEHDRACPGSEPDDEYCYKEE